VKLLDDDNLVVRQTAREALVYLARKKSGKRVDFGPPAGGNREKIDRAILRWTNWWKDQLSSKNDPARLVKDLLTAAPGTEDVVLHHFRESDGIEFTDALATAIPKLKGEAYKKARIALAERLARLNATSLREKLAESDPQIRRAAALACANRKFVQLAPEVITLLEEKDPDLPPAAWVALKALSGKDFGPVSTPDQRKHAARCYREWWRERGGSLKPMGERRE